MKRVMYLVMAALVSTVLVAPSAAAQGEQAQERVQQAQDRVDQARQYMESPEGQAALADARASLEQALQDAQAAVQGAVQEKKQEMTVKMEGTAPLPSSGGPAIGFSAVAAPAFALLV